MCVVVPAHRWLGGLPVTKGCSALAVALRAVLRCVLCCVLWGRPWPCTQPMAPCRYSTGCAGHCVGSASCMTACCLGVLQIWMDGTGAVHGCADCGCRRVVVVMFVCVSSTLCGQLTDGQVQGWIRSSLTTPVYDKYRMYCSRTLGGAAAGTACTADGQYTSGVWCVMCVVLGPVQAGRSPSGRPRLACRLCCVQGRC